MVHVSLAREFNLERGWWEEGERGLFQGGRPFLMTTPPKPWSPTH